MKLNFFIILLSIGILGIQSFDSNSPGQQINFAEKKLRDELMVMFDKLELGYSMMYQMVTTSNAYVIFDCEKPSYIKPGNQLAILKNHIINDHLKRIKDPRIQNETSAYMCDKKENIWRVNPEFFKSSGFIGFDDDKIAEADKNFIVFSDEKTIKEYFKNIDTDGKITKKMIELANKIIHHPKYYKIDKSKKPKLVDIYAAQDDAIPKWMRESRAKQIDELYEKFTRETKNFTIPKTSTLKQDTFGDGYSFIIFDCKDPSILHPTNKGPSMIKLNNTLFIGVLKKVGYCEKDNIWRSGKKPDEFQGEIFQTFDAKGQGLGFSPSSKLLKIMKIKGICDEYMKFMHHPAYYIKKYKKPEQCTSSNVEKEEEEGINKILDDHFNKKPSSKKPIKKEEVKRRRKTELKKTPEKAKKIIDESSSGFSSGFESE